MTQNNLHPSLLSDMLEEAAKKIDLPAIKSLVAQGARNDEAFLIEDLSKQDVEELFSVHEALLSAGHPLPKGWVGDQVLNIICAMSKNHWAKSNPLIEQILSQSDNRIRKSPTLFVSCGNSLAETGNMEALKLLIPSTATEDQVNQWYGKEKMESFPFYLLNNDENLEDKIKSLDYLLSIMPEACWQKIGQSRNTVVLPLISKAVRLGSEDLVRWLVERGASINSNPNANYGSGAVANPISCAIISNNFSMIPMLLDLGCSPNSSQNELFPPIIRAIRDDNIDLLQLLIDAGADINKETHIHLSPLSTAVFGDQTEVIERLIQNGADINQKGFDGATPILHSCIQDHLEPFILLLQAGASLDIEDNSGRKAIDIISKTTSIKPWFDAWVEHQALNENTSNVKKKQTKTLRL